MSTGLPTVRTIARVAGLETVAGPAWVAGRRLVEQTGAQWPAGIKSRVVCGDVWAVGLKARGGTLCMVPPLVGTTHRLAGCR